MFAKVPAALLLVLIVVGWCDAAVIKRQTVPERPHAHCGHWHGWRNVKKLFTFGDSYTTTSFKVTGDQPSASNPIGNPPFPGYTSSNGPNYIGYLTARYNRSQVLTYNLASGGATVDALLAEPYLPTVRSLIDQVVADFMPAYGVLPETERKAQWTSDDSLFIFFIGVNDVLKTYGANNATLVPQIFAEYGAMVDKVYSRGARNFLFLDVPTLQFSPLSLKFPATLNTETAALKDWAGRLSGLVDWLKERHPDVFAATFSTYSVFEKIIQNTKAFAQTQGLREISGFCEQYANGTPKGNTLVNGCKVPADEYFWLNNIHPTYPVHDALAFEIATALEGFPPSNICAPEDTQ